MHAPAYFQMTLHRFGVWRAMCVAWAVGAAAVLVAWMAQAAPPGWALLLAWLAWSAGSAVLLHGALRMAAWQLHWDTQRWFLRPARDGASLAAGQLAVALDLGAWLLLRFVPDGARAPHRTLWLPVQRRGHEALWHGLRVTLYCARPSFGDGAE